MRSTDKEVDRTLSPRPPLVPENGDLGLREGVKAFLLSEEVAEVIVIAPLA